MEVRGAMPEITKVTFRIGVMVAAGLGASLVSAGAYIERINSRATLQERRIEVVEKQWDEYRQEMRQLRDEIVRLREAFAASRGSK
jgi:uncharacterized coiled-coil protein SlyX